MMKNFTRYFFSISLVLLAQVVLAQPVNDSVCNAIELPVDGSISNHDNSLATIEADEVFAPAAGCQSQDGWCANTISNSMWFTFIAPSSGEVGITTCLTGSFDTKIAVWEVGDCSDFSTFTLLGANDDQPNGCNASSWASTLDVNGLTSGNTYYIQMDSFTEDFGASYNIKLQEGSLLPPPPAYLQIIHNSADLALSIVDVRVNGEFLTDQYGYEYGNNLNFRSLTPFLNITSGESMVITINSSTSTDDSSPLFTTTQTFDEGTNTILVLDGIISTTGYNPDYLSKPLNFFRYNDAINYGFDYTITNVLFHHGATDAPVIDINETNPNQEVLADNFDYSFFDGYQTFLTANGNLTLQITDADSTVEVESYVAPIQSNYWGGAGYTILASGFLDPANNSNGPAFGLWAAGPYGGNLFPLSTTGNSEYDDACNATTLATDGTPLALSNAGLGTQTGEPLPPYGTCYGNLSWCDWQLTSSIWAKFTAPASGLVTLTTCNTGTNFNTQVAVYSVTDCDDFSTYTLVGANDDQYDYCSFYYGTSLLPLCGLNPGEEYYVQIDGAYGQSGNFVLTATEGGTCFSRIQFIHNSADMAAEEVDIRVNGEFLTDQYGYEYGNDVPFRFSTPFMNVLSGEDLVITINPADSDDDSDPIQSFTENFDANKNLIAVIDGIASADGYDPDNTVRPLTIYYYDQGLDFTGDYSITKLLFHNGVTDVDSIDINEAGLGNIVDNLSYGEFDGYQTYPTTVNLNFQVTYGDGGDEIDNYIAPLYSNYWGGSAYTILSSGFLNTANNSDGPAFGLYATYLWGGYLYPLPSAGDIDYDDACNAYLFPTDGNATALSNLGLTAQENEPQPPAGNYNNFNGWGDNALNQTIWGKFVAPSSGDVSITTCSNNTTFNTQIAVYSVTDCDDFSTYSLVAANDDAPQYCEGGAYGNSFLPLCGLVPGQTYYVQVDNAYYWELGGNFEITITEGATCFARLQVINNSPDALVNNVDIRYSTGLINGDLLNDYLNIYDDLYPEGNDLGFRQNTSYMFVPSNTGITITVNPEGSTDDDDALYTKTIFLQANTSNILVMEGILSETGYEPNNIDAGFDLKLITNTRESSADFATTDVLFYHGSTDMPNSNINQLLPIELDDPLVNELSFREASPYTSFVTQNGYMFQATLAAFEDIELVRGEASFTQLYLGGAAATVLVSGFSDPSANSDGPELGLWLANRYGGNLIPLLKNNAVCDAISVPNDGTLFSTFNFGSSYDAGEVSPPFGFDCTTEWCDYSLDNTVWYKFVANSQAAEISTCAEGSYFDSQLAIWGVEECGDYSTYVLKGSADNNNCTYNYSTAVAIACGLDSGTTYYIQLSGSYGWTDNFKISVTPNDGSDCAVGLEENKELAGLSIFPNPTASGILNVNYELNVSGTSRIELLDVLGNKLQIVDLGKIAAGKVTRSIDVSNLSNGLYFVNIIHNNKIISNKVQVQK
jgi:Secretion system C-terminal sorting domain